MQNWGKMLPFRCFFHPLQSMFASQTSSLEDCNMPFTKHKHGPYEAQTWHLRGLNMALTKREIKIKLSLNKEVYTQTMLMARHQKIDQLFDEDFWVTYNHSTSLPPNPSIQPQGKDGIA